MTARFGTKRRTKRIVTNHGMPVRWSTAHYRFSRAPCTATLYRPPSLTRSFASFPLSLSPSASLPSTDDFPVSLCRSLPITLSRFHQPSFLLLLFSTIIPSLPSNDHRLTRARTLFHGASTWRRGTRAAFPPCLSRGVPLSQAITDFSRLLRRHSVPPPPHSTPPPRLPLTLSIRLAPPLDDETRRRFSLLSLSFCRLNYIAPPVDRSSNSTMCREIKFVYSHCLALELHRIQAATKLDKTRPEEVKEGRKRIRERERRKRNARIGG